MEIIETEVHRAKYLNLVVDKDHNIDHRRFSNEQKKDFFKSIGVSVNFVEHLSLGFPEEYADDAKGTYYDKYDLKNIVEVYYTEFADGQSLSSLYNEIKEEFEYLVQTNKINNFFKNHE